MAADEISAVVFNLLDSYWFEYGVFAAKPPPSVPSPAKAIKAVDLEQDQDLDDDGKPKLQRITTQMIKSHSDQLLSSKLDYNSSDNSPVNSPSPKSVLQTILSGKEIDSFEDSSILSPDQLQQKENSIDNSNCIRKPHTEESENKHSRGKTPAKRRRRKSTGSRSLSELEFEEVKGFMDLGFVFPDEVKDSKLAAIIPGLQRLGKNVEENSSVISRPYLSEAWDSLEDQKKLYNPLLDWRIPAFGNEMELKHHLKSWAHTVASVVR